MHSLKQVITYRDMFVSKQRLFVEAQRELAFLYHFLCQFQFVLCTLQDDLLDSVPPDQTNHLHWSVSLKSCLQVIFNVYLMHDILTFQCYILSLIKIPKPLLLLVNLFHDLPVRIWLTANHFFDIAFVDLLYICKIC